MCRELLRKCAWLRLKTHPADMCVRRTAGITGGRKAVVAHRALGGTTLRFAHFVGQRHSLLTLVRANPSTAVVQGKGRRPFEADGEKMNAITAYDSPYWRAPLPTHALDTICGVHRRKHYGPMKADNTHRESPGRLQNSGN